MIARLLFLALLLGGALPFASATLAAPHPDCTVLVSTPSGYPSQGATDTVRPGIPQPCITHLPGQLVLSAGGQTAAVYGSGPVHGRAIFRFSGSSPDAPGGYNIVVTVSAGDLTTDPENLPALFADAILTMPTTDRLYYFDPAKGTFQLVPNGHLRRAGLYRVVRHDLSPFPEPAQPTLPSVLPRTGASPFGGLLEIALFLCVMGIVMHLRSGRGRLRRLSRGVLLFGSGCLLGTGSFVALLLVSLTAPASEFGSLTTIPSATILPHVTLPPPSRIVIPTIGVDTNVLELHISNGAWQIPAYAAGYLAPTGWSGYSSNVVVTGHDDQYGSVFRRLAEIKAGDDVVLYAGTTLLHYRVFAARTVPPSRIDLLQPGSSPILTLITCSPYLVDTERLVVRARLL